MRRAAILPSEENSMSFEYLRVDEDAFGHSLQTARSSLSSQASSYRGARRTFSNVASLAPQKNGWLDSIKEPSLLRFLGIALRQIPVKRSMRARQKFCKGKTIISIVRWGPSAGGAERP
jgi:hypothetical protein